MVVISKMTSIFIYPLPKALPVGEGGGKKALT